MALKAKIEIAKTYYEDLEFEKAGRLYKRLLSQQHGESELVAVDRPLVHFAAIDSYFRGENWEKVIEEGLDFLGCIGTISRRSKYVFAWLKLI